ncbi:MAG TPA: hypothetical protein VKA39_07755, partial [Beijerinckiaceae bacterium]|nr:hypothetical protein [Beijerinckiaceae bacterium]
ELTQMRGELVGFQFDLEIIRLKRALAQKYRPDQRRVPAGNATGGQWTGGSGTSTTPSPPRRTRLAQNVSTTSPARSDAEFGPDRSGWHHYTAGPNQVCPADLQCSREEIADQLARFSVPGQDPATPVTDRSTNPVYAAGILVGDVRTTTSEDGLTITNRTREGHIFFDGVVVRSAHQAEDGTWYVTTRGFGNSVTPGMNIPNQYIGPELFDELDGRMRANIEGHHGKANSIAGVRALDRAFRPRRPAFGLGNRGEGYHGR